jgi:opacity protein-like surface antigen
METVVRCVVAFAVVASMVLAMASATSAENFYAAVRGGPGVTTDTRATTGLGNPRTEELIEFKTGFTAGAGVGYRFPFGLRAEGELGYLWVPLKRQDGVDVDGSMKSYLLMANAYYDFAFPFLGPFRPYVGGGLGAARVNDDHQIVAHSVLTSVGLCASSCPPPKIDIDKWRTAFAYQARGGVIYDVNEWLDLSLGYRYVHIDGGHYHIGLAVRPVNSGAQNNHSVELGFAVKF